MMTYADSSVLVAWFHADDQFALEVTEWAQNNGMQERNSSTSNLDPYGKSTKPT